MQNLVVVGPSGVGKSSAVAGMLQAAAPDRVKIVFDRQTCDYIALPESGDGKVVILDDCSRSQVGNISDDAMRRFLKTGGRVVLITRSPFETNEYLIDLLAHYGTRFVYIGFSRSAEHGRLLQDLVMELCEQIATTGKALASVCDLDNARRVEVGRTVAACNDMIARLLQYEREQLPLKDRCDHLLRVAGWLIDVLRGADEILTGIQRPYIEDIQGMLLRIRTAGGSRTEVTG
jgi:hypothetical protein